MRLNPVLLLSIACSGNVTDEVVDATDTEETGKPEPTDPSFTPDLDRRLALTSDTSCVIDGQGELVCWGAQAEALPNKLTTGLVAIARSDFGGPQSICVADAKTTFCRGGNLDNYTLIVEGATAVATSVSHVCALSDGDVTCGGTFCSGNTCVLPAKKSGYTEVVASFGRTCALSDGHIVCTSGGPPQPTADRTDFVALAKSVNFDCAIDQAGEATCWGPGVPKGFADGEMPGDLVAMSAANLVACGLKSSGLVTCWGSDETNPSVVDDAPSGQFDEVHISPSHGCARRGDDVTCWGDDDQGQATPPA